MACLRADNLTYHLENRSLLSGVSLSVESDQVVGLLGPNGAGKTTLFSLLIGLLHPKCGHVQLDNQDISSWPLHQRARHGIAFLPQQTSIFRGLSVEDNLMVALESKSLPNRHQRLEQLLDAFSLQGIRKQIGSVLSGGETRRTEFARSMALDPQFLLLDEPFAGVDPLSIKQIKGMIETCKQNHIGIIISDHHAEATMAICDQVYILHQGENLCHGTPDELRANPLAKSHYFG
jgi:lipopolysaccharide export system ATP-binding protein